MRNSHSRRRDQTQTSITAVVIGRPRANPAPIGSLRDRHRLLFPLPYHTLNTACAVRGVKARGPLCIGWDGLAAEQHTRRDRDHLPLRPRAVRLGRTRSTWSARREKTMRVGQKRSTWSARRKKTKAFLTFDGRDLLSRLSLRLVCTLLFGVTKKMTSPECVP